MIHVSARDGALVVVLDRPERRNALDHAHCQQLAAIVRGCSERALVLAGDGPHFCAGADLTGVEDADFVAVLHDALDALVTAPFPTIAAVHGAALGAGMQLAVACDLRVATTDARFGIPAARLGLMVDHWTVTRLQTVVGHGPASAMLLAAEEYDGAAGHRVGFVQRLGDRDDAVAWAASIAEMAPLTIAGHKLGLRTRDGYDEALAAAWSSEDLQEGMAARREKRPARFRGR